MHGQFIWYELTTPAPATALKFYPRFTGWGTQAFDKDYTMFTHGGVPVAGVFTLTDDMRTMGVPPNWMPYVEVSDVDASATLAKSLGASVVHGPADVPNVGRFAVIVDPQGAMFGVYKSAVGGTGWDGTSEVGRFSWHELMARDHAKALEFYGRMFGWEKMGEMDMGGGQMYVMFGKSGQMYGGLFTMFGDMAGMHPFWLVYIHVKDVPKAVAIATKAGATVQRPPMDIPGGVISILGDPAGAAYAVHHVTAVAAAPKAKAKPAPSKKRKAAPKKAAKRKAAPKKAAKRKAAPKKAAKRKAAPKKAAKRKPAKRSAKKPVRNRRPARKRARRK